MEHIHNCGNCAHFNACDEIMKRYAGFSGISKDGLACVNYAVRIEDILGDDYDLDRLRELVEADRGGRCVVLPCKVGESLWIHDKDGKPREMILDKPDIRCHCKEEDNLCMVLCRAKHMGVCAKRLFNDGSDIGKTVFLTREEAEAALRRGRND